MTTQPNCFDPAVESTKPQESISRSRYEIASFQIPMPDKKTQQQIANILATLEKKQELHQRKHATLTALFRSLLHHLMTAQIRVRDLDLPELKAIAAE